MQDNSPFPYFDGTTPAGTGPYGQFDNTGGHSENNRPKVQPAPENSKLDAIFSKQRAIKALFAIDGQRLEIMPVHGDEPAVICYPRVVSIDFQDGLYINRCDYTITLEADKLLNKNLTIDDDGNPLSADSKIAISGANDGHTTQQVIALSGAFIESFSESWNIEVDDERAENLSIPRSYRITHNISCPRQDPSLPIGWSGAQNTYGAKNYVVNNLLAKSGVLDYPNTSPLAYPSVNNQLGSGTPDLVNTYRGFNHTRTEDIDVAGVYGSFSVSETFLLASGDSYEDYSMSVSKGIDNAFVNVSIDGTITGLNEVSPSGYGAQPTKPSGAYDNALKKYHDISKSGQFGLTSSIYRRAQNSVPFELNSQPKSISLGLNEFNGEITYSLEFDNRPTNIISGVLSENISVNDTYPGDVFAVVPVIGRATGPVLQYVGSRTEYKRDVQIELQMDYTDLHYAFR